MTPEQKAWIDNASLVDLLRRWRYGSGDDEMFQGDTGHYFSDRLFILRDADPAAWTAASKQAGWGKS